MTIMMLMLMLMLRRRRRKQEVNTLAVSDTDTATEAAVAPAATVAQEGPLSRPVRVAGATRIRVGLRRTRMLTDCEPVRGADDSGSCQ